MCVPGAPGGAVNFAGSIGGSAASLEGAADALQAAAGAAAAAAAEAAATGQAVCVPLPPFAQRAGPRDTIYFDPSTVTAAVITTGVLLWYFKHFRPPVLPLAWQKPPAAASNSLSPQTACPPACLPSAAPLAVDIWRKQCSI